MTANQPTWLEPRPDDIADAARQLPADMPGGQRLEAVRTSILVAAKVDSRRTGPGSARYLPWAAAAIAAGVAVWIGVRATGTESGSAGNDTGTGNDTSTGPTADRRASVQASAAADFVHTSTRSSEDGTTDEIVRLKRGRVTVAVHKLAESERFRVVTADAEVEVRGTSFDVVVQDDRLMAVVVHTGLVEVRLRDRDPILLAAGERWGLGAEVEHAALDPDLSRDRVADLVANPDADPVADPATVDDPASSIGAVASADPAPAPRGRSAIESRDESPVVEPLAATPEPAREPVPAPAEPTDTERAFDAGWTALRAGNYGTAAFQFQRAIDDAPDAPLAEDARYWRAIALARAGKTADARDAMREFLSHHAGSARSGEIAVMLGRILADDGEIQAARKLFESARNHRNPDVRAAASSALDALDATR